jgi:hypothetical protein
MSISADGSAAGYRAIAEVVVRAVGHFLVEVLFIGIFYWPGWLFLRAPAFGRYPPRKPRPHSNEFAAFGFAVLPVGALLTVPGGGFRNRAIISQRQRRSMGQRHLR